MSRANHTPYHVIKNVSNLPSGTYSGKWTGYTVEVDGQGEIFTDRSVRGLNIPVRVEVTTETVKIYLADAPEKGV